ncbi:MAG TPA: AMP-binding protein, partial [Planctomycetota bacterium]|nr:AMP-binding protein [Planctomycetota bacterium]
MKIGHLAEYLEASTVRFPDRTAVVGPVGEGLTYSELNRRSDALAAFFVERGIQQGDRVGVVLPKSVESVVAFFGIMKAGAAYVPVDAAAPAERSRRILADCKVRALITERGRLDVIPPAGDISLVLLTGETTDEPRGIGWEISRFESATRCGVPRTKPRNRRDLAYILYTSGSTGEPKGVMLTHENASSFIEWCSTVFHPSEHDRFSSHAPFHFDLSILDLYLAIKHGASVHLISEELGRNPRNLARFIGERRLTVWYSTPSILTLLLQFGNLPSHDLSHLRLILFAGEVFPVKHLRDLQRCLPAPVYYNLYGPTETNVCTFARIPERIPETRDMPYPIGP